MKSQIIKILLGVFFSQFTGNKIMSWKELKYSDKKKIYSVIREVLDNLKTEELMLLSVGGDMVLQSLRLTNELPPSFEKYMAQ